MISPSSSFLIKLAIANGLRFVMESPLTDHTPNELTPDDVQYNQELYQRLVPGRKMVVDARIKGRQRLSSDAVQGGV